MPVKLMQNTGNFKGRVWPPQIFALGPVPNPVRTLYSGVLLKCAVRPLHSDCTRTCTNGRVPVHFELYGGIGHPLDF
jgi:hypothetical protein